jgi:hydrogenase/urease accessory protein HupE
VHFVPQEFRPADFGYRQRDAICFDVSTMISRWKCLMAIAFLAVLVSGEAMAHAMKQVRAEIASGSGTWTASVWLEAWALYPEDGAKIPKGTPGDPGTAGAAWVAGLDAGDHQIMRETAAGFLDETFVLTLGGKRLKAEYSYPDYTVVPLSFKETDAGNSLVRIDMNGPLPSRVAGLIELTWLDDEDEPLVIDVISPLEGGGKKKLLRLSPKQAPAKLMEIHADGAASLIEKSSSLGVWIAAGFRHILPLGVDHILFILGLFLLQPKMKPLLWQTSAFTVAHSITLALVVLGFITAPASVVEPMIALSIAYVGIENLWVKELKPWRVALVFGLGLLHGMGFASVMKELDLPEGRIINPLVGFNIGVELGQIAVLALAFAGTFWLFKHPNFDRFRKTASAVIAVVGIYWTIERIFM